MDKKTVKLLGFCCLLTTAAFLAGCSVRTSNRADRTVEFHPDKDFLKTAVNLTSEEEGTIGKAVVARILSIYKTLDDKRLQNYLSQIGETLAAASDRPDTFYGYRFIILDSEEINAISAPGGVIFITKGFLKLVQDEDTLAGILAHEITHVVKLHGLIAVQPSNFSNYQPVADKVGSALDCTGLLSQGAAAMERAVSDIVDKLVLSGFSKDQEYAADYGATLIMKKAGYEPHGLYNALEILKSKKAGSGGWFKTHPSAADRIKELSSAGKSIISNQTAYDIRKQRFDSIMSAYK